MIRINKTQIKIVYGDITEQDTEAIVNPTSSKLTTGSDIAISINRKAGHSIGEQCSKISALKIGDTVLTNAGNLKTKNIIHAIITDMPAFKLYEINNTYNEKNIRTVLQNILKLVTLKKIKSLALPPLGCGNEIKSYKKCLNIMLEELKKFLDDNPDTNLIEVRFVTLKNEIFESFSNYIIEMI